MPNKVTNQISFTMLIDNKRDHVNYSKRTNKFYN